MAESWAPLLEQVADHIPTRTRNKDAPSDDTLQGTFNEATTPTGEQAQRHINAACREVLAAIGGTLPGTPAFVTGMAADTAALRAAATIELAYPDRQADVSVYEQLNERADAALQRLVDAVNDAGSGTDGSLLPQWAMPAPGWPGDYPL